ncbi:hypothetical protein EW146_g10195 [Bondarzewia mesenterica]|uniref:Uncharacterized protein n=1 Tax=Bondarzewia mesenterica TaxID=1095465 RepID=A0A4S4KZI4_9AGAM|nr:hypothetical protein EW146_g10195 [Bondarzewia mesenterica]
MAIMDSPGDQDMGRLWGLLTELAEQTNKHKSYTASLHAQAGNVKNQAIHSQTGFVLRRYGTLPCGRERSHDGGRRAEEYEAELERMNAAMSAENQSLVYDNKQLNALIKDYETTLETVMTQFRNRAHEVQEQELSLIRDYETRLISRETEERTHQLADSTAYTESLCRVSTLLRRLTRTLNGEDASSAPEGFDADDWDDLAAADWSLERECELARLEQENALLRSLLRNPVDNHNHNSHHDANDDSLPPTAAASSSAAPTIPPTESMTLTLPVGPRPRGTILGGPKGTVGPFGTYKKMRGGG